MSATSLSVGVVIGAVLSAGSGKAFRDAARRTAELGEAIKKTERKAAGLRQKKAALGQTIRESGDATGKLAAKYDRLGRAIERAKRKLQGYRRESIGAHREMARASLGSAQAIGATVAGGAYVAGRLIGSAFERDEVAAHLRNVLVSDNVEKDLEAALAHARDAVRSRASLHSEVELLEIQYALNSAGLEASAARTASTIASQVATLTRGAPEQVAEVVATTFGNLGDSLEGSTEERLARVGDILTRAQHMFQIRDFGQLGEGMSTIAASASLARLDIAQTAAAIGLFNSMGKQGSEAGTSFDAVLRELGPAAEELGFSIVRGADDGLDLVATLESLDAALAGYSHDVDARQAIIRKSFGDEGKIVGDLLKKLPQLRQAVDEMRGSGGYVGKLFPEFADEDFAKWKNLLDNIGILGKTLGDSPELGKWLDRLGTVVVLAGEALDDSEELRTSIASLGIGLAAAGVGAVGIKLASFALHQFVAVFKLAWGALKLVGDAISWVWKNKALRAGLGVLMRLAVGAVAVVGAKILIIGAAIAGAALLIYKFWEPIKGFFVRLWDDIAARFHRTVGAWVKVFTDFSGTHLGAAILETVGLATGATPGALPATPAPPRLAGPGLEPSLSGRAILGAQLRAQQAEELALPTLPAPPRIGPVLELPPSGGSILEATGGQLEGLRDLPREARPTVMHVDRVDNRIILNITQQAGESADEVADRVMQRIERMRAQQEHGALYDPVPEGL